MLKFLNQLVKRLASERQLLFSNNFLYYENVILPFRFWNVLEIRAIIKGKQAD